ncbi:transglycosylase SLT domain-containing protein [Candidatus Woesearchaeota archaeon]|nr:transglycosylase SLT domain-containing protein [Candidatus Woesearchaeota archaeon]
MNQDKYIQIIRRDKKGNITANYVKRNSAKSNRLKKAVMGGLALAVLAAGISTLKGSKHYPIENKPIIENIIEQNYKPTSNNSIESSLESAIERNRDRLTNNLYNKRSIGNSFSELSKYDDYLTKASNETNIDKNLLYAIFAAESKGKLRANSHKGAKGPAQLMKGTAKEMGLKIDDVIDERYDPEKAFVAGAKYLKKYNQFNEDHLILISYNYGPTVTNKMVKKYGKSWDNLKSHLPNETRNYVIKVLSRKQLLDDGFYFDKKILFSEILGNTNDCIIEKGDTINKISREKGKSVKEIKENNPHIRNYNKIKPGMVLKV